MKKKILLLVPMLHQGGFERVAVQTARLLQETYEVTIAIFSDRDLHYDVTGLTIVNINCDVVKGRVGKLLNVFRRARKVGRVKREKRIDLTYSFGESANLVNVFSRTHGKTVTGIRCSTDMESARFVRLFTERSDTVIACSREIEKELREGYDCRRTVTLYNPLDTEAIVQSSLEKKEDDPCLKEIAKRKAEGDRVLVTMGRDDIIKGYWHLVKAVHLLTKQGEPVTLVVMGAGSFAKAKKLAADLGITDRILFAGNQTNPFPYVAAADAYVLSSNHEGFPNALLEAMALGLPVIATDCRTGPAEILTEDDAWTALTREVTVAPYGVILPDLDGHEDYDAASITKDDALLADAIAKVVTDEDLRAVLGTHASVRAGQFTPARYLAKLSEIIEGTLGEKAANQI